MKKEIRTRHEPYVVYITSDGKEFANERIARQHEESLLSHRDIQSRYIIFYTVEDGTGFYCYKIKSEEDLKYLNANEWRHNASWDYEGPGWYIAFKHDGRDYADDYSVSHIESYIDYLKNDLTELMELEKE